MANGACIGKHPHLHWDVELSEFRGVEFVHADRMRVEGGALIFLNGELFSEAVVEAFAPHQWASAYPVPDGHPGACYGCPEGDDE